ncbi:putative membrane protein [Litorimonas taeanensis]|uniref:Putative membrane protein n=1 Tax=Litorimonas taeanensis TaxID=568099 RepID=A0A420WEB6_9PROT|nr:DUF1036 domain-containing protein [Litorimonas taeanensis]RKQ69242.1 putative membrane protein [Litorimonas taeanensis]
MRKQVTLALTLAFALSGFPATASAQTSETDTNSVEIINPANTASWNICNETSFILRLAHATLRDGQIKAKGWREAQPGQCIVETIVENAPRFLYAESSPIHRGGIREWKGEATLCAKDTDFESAATDNCRVQNLETRPYFAVKPGEDTTTLIEPADFGENALTAGTQRLLRDAGYKITAIDGMPGRRTARSLREFQKKEALDDLPEGEALISALAISAAAKTKEIGLEFCNKSDSRIYTAIGLQEDGNWTSRGWWELAPESCVRPVTEDLKGLDVHYYALKESLPGPANDVTAILTGTGDAAINERADLKLRSIATIPAQFCIAEAQFSALGREMCLESGYGVANFRPLPTDKESLTISLTNEDFAQSGPAGLRQ